MSRVFERLSEDWPTPADRFYDFHATMAKTGHLPLSVWTANRALKKHYDRVMRRLLDDDRPSFPAKLVSR